VRYVCLLMVARAAHKACRHILKLALLVAKSEDLCAGALCALMVSVCLCVSVSV
jgi:hypothetical protein